MQWQRPFAVCKLLREGPPQGRVALLLEEMPGLAAAAAAGRMCL